MAARYAEVGRPWPRPHLGQRGLRAAVQQATAFRRRIRCFFTGGRDETGRSAGGSAACVAARLRWPRFRRIKHRTYCDRASSQSPRPSLRSPTFASALKSRESSGRRLDATLSALAGRTVTSAAMTSQVRRTTQFWNASRYGPGGPCWGAGPPGAENGQAGPCPQKLSLEIRVTQLPLLSKYC